MDRIIRPVGKPARTSLAGYSLLETMITISLLAVLVAISAPSLAGFLLKNELSTTTNALFGSLSFARTHAITHQQIVHICQLDSSASTTCSDNYNSRRDWSKGWLVFADLNNNNQLDETDNLLRTVQMKTSASVVFNQRGRLRFFPSGSSRSAGYYLCHENLEEVRHVYLLYTGRARVDKRLSREQREICLQAKQS